MRKFEPSCTVVICTRDRPTELARCLEAISRLNYSNFTVLVVDNAPSTGASKAVAAHRGVDYMVEQVAGLSRARNRGALAARSEIVAYLDDDSVPDPDWLRALSAEFDDKTVMSVTGRILPMADKTPVPHTLGAEVWEERRRLDCGNPLWFEIASFGGIGDGGNMAFRRSAFDHWSGFDERLGRGAPIHGGEEHLAHSSLIEAGYAVVYTPTAVVYHPQPGTLEALRQFQLEIYTTGAAYACLLLIESPRRGRVLKYYLQALFGTRRQWRGPQASVVSRFQIACACLAGTALYARACFRGRATQGAERSVSSPQEAPVLERTR